MKRRSEDVATRRPLRRFERRAGRRWTPESLPSFRAPFPVADSIFQWLAAPFPSDRAGGRASSRTRWNTLHSYPPTPVAAATI
jgi:hypothetical protein